MAVDENTADLNAGAHAGLHARHRAVLPEWMALYYDKPIEIVSGSGCRVTDSEGNSYLDFFAGILTTMVGYDAPEVRAALERQIATGVLHTSTLYLIRSQVELAERIVALSGIPDAKVFFTPSGTEANEAALLFCATYRRSNQVLALRNSYHGRSFAAAGITGNRGWSASSLSPLSVAYVHGGYRFRSPFKNLPDDEFIAACVEDLKDVILTATAGDVGCLIAEPVQGVGGFLVPPDGLLGAFKEVLDEHGILLVSDEVQTGWGRTGEHFWGIQAHGIVPDAMTFAKGLGNGLSIGGVVARRELVDAPRANGISTFGGNPLATAAGLAVLDLVTSRDLQANAHAVGLRLLTGIRELAARHWYVGDVRGKGLMAGVEIVQPGTTEPDLATTAALLEATRERGLLVGKGGMHGNVLRIAPPLTLSAEECDEGLGILADAMLEVSREPQLAP